VKEKCAELLRGGEVARRWKGVELKEITPWEVRTNYILVFNEGGNTRSEGDADCALSSPGNVLLVSSNFCLVWISKLRIWVHVTLEGPFLLRQWVREWLNEWVREWLSAWMSERVSVWASERVWMTECANESARERVSACLLEWIREWVRERVNAWVRVCECIREWVNECMSAWVSSHRKPRYGLWFDSASNRNEYRAGE
jgi:hypothetical protein